MDAINSNGGTYKLGDTISVQRMLFWGGPGDRGDDISANGAYTHMTMLAENAEGLRNLFRLSSLASLEGFYYKPRMDKQLLAEHRVKDEPGDEESEPTPVPGQERLPGVGLEEEAEVPGTHIVATDTASPGFGGT